MCVSALWSLVTPVSQFLGKSSSSCLRLMEKASIAFKLQCSYIGSLGGVLMYTSGAFDLFMFSTSTLSRFFVLIIAWHQRNSSFSVRFIDLFWQYSSETDKTLERLLAMSCHNVSMYAASRTSPLQPISIRLKAVWCASLYYGGVYVVLSTHHTAHKTPGLKQVHLSAVVYTSLDTALT